MDSLKDSNVLHLSSALAAKLGLPTEEIERALSTIMEQNNVEISKNKRKDSLSSLIEITQDGETSINVKLPNLYIQPPSQPFNSREVSKQPKSELLIDISQPPSPSPSPSPRSPSPRSPSPSPDVMYSMQESNEEFETPPTSSRNLPWNDLGGNEMQEELGGWEEMGVSYKPTQSSTDEMSVQVKSEPALQGKSNRSFDLYNNDGWNSPNVCDTSIPWNEVESDTQQPSVDNVDSFECTDNKRNITNSQVNESTKITEKKPSVINHNNNSSFVSTTLEDTPQNVQDTIKNKSLETYSSEWPSLSDAAKKSDTKRNSEVDLGAWGSMNINIASAWGKPKKWISETETKKPEIPVTPVWNPDDINKRTWQPIQEPKAPFFFKKKPINPVHFEFDDNEGWGNPPSKTIPWNDSRQGYCVDLIEEQKETTFWSMQNGSWVNVSEELRITQEKKTVEVEYTPDGLNRKDVRTQTQTQRIERQGIPNLENATWDDIREQTRREREEHGLVKSDSVKPIIIELTDHSDDENSNSSNSSVTKEIEDNLTTAPISVECSRERLGNPQWKVEKEWRQLKLVECDDLINFNVPFMSDLKSSGEEPGDRDELAEFFGYKEELPNWNKIGNVSDNYPLKNGSIKRSTEKLVDTNTDPWFFEDLMTEEKRQDNIINKPVNNTLLINLDSNSDYVDTNSNIINHRPQIFHGTINNEISNISDLLSDSTNPVMVSTDVNMTNHSELNLLLFEDEDDNTPKSSDEIIPVETTLHENKENKKKNSINFDEFEVFLENNISTPDTEVSNSTKTITNGGEYPIHLTVETQSYGRKTLYLRYDDDPKVAASEFCKQWEMSEYEDALKGFVQKELKKKLRKQRAKRRK